jgi:hypothetical protein
MASPKRTKGQRELDLIEIAELYCQGIPQQKIATTLSSTRDYTLSQPQIAYDIETLLERWKQQSNKPIDEHIAEELARVNNLERTYWNAWKKSCNSKQSTIKESINSGKASKIKASAKVEEMMGNPSFLTGVQWCINKRCELLGLDAQNKSDGSNNTQIIITGTRRDEVPEPSDPI